MKSIVLPAVFFLSLQLCFCWTTSPAVAEEAKAKTCRMEQQCRWENFKKICVYVKVCR